jgi:hypothetical protein
MLTMGCNRCRRYMHNSHPSACPAHPTNYPATALYRYNLIKNVQFKAKATGLHTKAQRHQGFKTVTIAKRAECWLSQCSAQNSAGRMHWQAKVGLQGMMC